MSAVHSNINCNSIDVTINHKRTRVLIDTGASYSCVNADFARRAHLVISSSSPDSPPKLLGASGDRLNVIGTTTANVCISGYRQSADLVVIEGLYHNVIFGLDTLREMNAVIDVSNSTLSIANNTLTGPLIVRFSPTNIVRTIECNSRCVSRG